MTRIASIALAAALGTTSPSFADNVCNDPDQESCFEFRADVSPASNPARHESDAPNDVSPRNAGAAIEAKP